MTPAQRINLSRLFNPRHIAFIGGRDAAVAIGEAKRIGYPGRIWPINPHRAELAGFTCFASVAQLPEAPDAVFLAVPVVAAIETLASLSSIGAGGVVCYTAGFSEAGDDGKAAERALVAAAGDMALIGPNCYGLINYVDRVALWPFAHGAGSPGFGAAIITQSGMLSSDLTMSQRSVPFTHMISIGNQAVLTIEDMIDSLCEKPQVRAIGLHIEGIKNIGRFADVALKAIDFGKPIVALKTGRSAIGKSLTVSHTASISGDDDLYDALFDRVGVLQVGDPANLLETLKFLCIAGIPKGNRLAGFTCSGGGATMLADYADEVDLVFPPPGDSTAQTLKELLPPVATVSNPLDYTTPIWGMADRTGPVFAAGIAGGADAAILVQDYPAEGLDESKPFYTADSNSFSEAATAAVIPAAICSTLPENLDRATREHLIARGIAPMQGIHEALNAIANACQWGAARQRIRSNRPGELFAPSPTRPRRHLDEAAGKRELAAAGIAVPQGRLASGADAPIAAAAIGFPVAVKMMSPDLLHKTEAGAVALGLTTEATVAEAVVSMRFSVGRRHPDLTSDRFLVEAMHPPPCLELIVGARQDPQFGLAMTLGSGGTLVELLADAITILLPCNEADIGSALASLKVARLMDGFRGRPAIDKAELVAAIVKIARFIAANRNRIVELEINPLLVYQDRVCAVDVLMSVADDIG